VKWWQRAARFYAVGAGGIVVQLAALAVFKSGLHLHYLVATALAVEAAVLHNYLWHERWTWSDRPARGRLARLVRFHAGNGLISIAANVALMRLFVGALHIPYLAANAASIAVCSLANYVVSDRLVFTRSRSM
jgi:putative flippase GtrA